MSTRSLKKQLTGLRHGHDRIAANPAWVARNRELLLSQIRNTVTPTLSDGFSTRALKQFSQGFRVFLPTHVLATVRSVSFVSLAVLLAVGGWIASVSAAQNSLPGDALYNVKLATEKTELLVASVVGGQKSKVNALLKHASNRVDEFHKSKTTDQARVVIRSLKESIESTSQSLEQVGTASPPDAAQLAKTVNDKTEQLLDSLSVISSEDAKLVAQNAAAAVDLEKEVGEATHLIEVAGVKAVQVLAEKTLAGDTSVDPQDVKDSVQKKLDNFVTDFSEINKDAATVSTAMASGISGVAPIISPLTSSGTIATTSLLTTTDSSTIGVAPSVVAPTPTPDGQAPSAPTVGEIVEKTVAEAKSLIQNNDLLGALKKVEVLSDVKKDTGTAVIQARLITAASATSTAVSSTLPIAPSAPPSTQ